jgi:hypothetical protein
MACGTILVFALNSYASFLVDRIVIHRVLIAMHLFKLYSAAYSCASLYVVHNSIDLSLVMHYFMQYIIGIA